MRWVLGPFGPSHQERKWAEYPSEKDYAMKSWFNIQHADLHPTKTRCTLHSLSCYTEELNKNKPDFIQVENLHSDGIVYIDKATDDETDCKIKSTVMRYNPHRRLYVRL